MTGLMELGRASWWHTNFLRAMGARMGRGVYWDVSAFSVSPTATIVDLLCVACDRIHPHRTRLCGSGSVAWGRA